MARQTVFISGIRREPDPRGSSPDTSEKETEQAVHIADGTEARREQYPLTPGLPKPSLWVDPSLLVLDQGRPVCFRIQDVFNYHGLDAVGGAVLGFRLLQRAFAELSPEGPAERRSISLFTSFPGFGVRDACELISRMVAEGRYRADPGFIDERAPDGVNGRCYFRFSLGDRSVELAPPPAVPDAEFIYWGRAAKQSFPEAAEYSVIMRNWKRAKFHLASLLLGLDCRSALRVLK